MLGRVMLTCDSFALVGWTSTPKGGYVHMSKDYLLSKHYHTCNHDLPLHE
jgi:hypothetical protein